MFKEMEDRDDCFVFHNKDGHEVKVAKKGLSQSMMKKIQGFAKGGEVKKPEAPVSQDTAQIFAQGFNQPTLGSSQKPKKYAEGTPVGGVPDPTAQLVDPQAFVQQQQVEAAPPMPAEQTIPIEETQRDLASMSGWDQAKALASFVGDKAKQAYNAVDSSELGHTLLTGGQDPRAPQQAAPQLQPAMSQQAAPSIQNVAMDVPRGTQNAAMQIPIGADPMQAVNQLQSGIRQEAKAAGELGQQQSKLYDQEANKYQNLMANYEEQQKHLTDEYEAIKQDYASGKINPNQYFENRGTFGNIRTGLAMILGGMGAGLTGGENQVIKYVQSQIDRDIDAQKANLGKKENLLSANLKQYGNLKDAMTATKLAYSGMIDAQLNKLAAQSQSPLKQAAAQKFLAEFQIKNGAEIQQMAQRRSVFNSLQQNGLGTQQAGMRSGNNDQLEHVNQLIDYIVPEHERKKATEEVEMLRNYQSGSSEIRKIYDEMKQLGISANVPFSTKSAKFTALKARLYQAARQGMKGQGTLSDQEVDQAVSPLIPAKLDALNGGRIDAMQEQMQGIIGNGVQKGAPTLTRYFQRYGFNPGTTQPNTRRMSTGAGFQRASMKN